ncbi:uncharacterized protein LOC129596355 [Paramacrobiotus metropolitanus]|uniref:uncharacterized protein LOC129596355 n=1 Tax=Paramacrobiotus metropolitanus TaxID=2943436 RepID=UPI002445FA14|nr:uncharacterized protein LOC129596355 [Paramacrobiotus metropolitanus]
MLKYVVILALVGVALAQKSSVKAKASSGATFSHQYVFDWTKVLTNPEIFALLAQRDVVWPQRYEYDIPAPSFTCSDKQYPGYYADPATKCQTFHRCDINGNMTSYICVNRTLFNPITLICDYWFNVDCDAFIKDENFANRRLYTSEVLFDTPGNNNQGSASGPNGNWVWVDNAGGAASADKSTGNFKWVENNSAASTEAPAAQETTAATAEAASAEETTTAATA